MMNSQPLLEVTNVSQRFAGSMRQAMRYGAVDILRQLMLPWRPASAGLRPGEFWALRDVSFSLRRGESVGILGNNGAGKSTLLKLIAGIYRPTLGRIRVGGRIGAIVELGSAFSPNLTGRENIRPQALLHGYSEALLRRQMGSILEFADLGNFIDSPVRHYSTGMRARLGFAVAVHGEPDLLVVDEVLAVGDLAFQNKCLRFVEQFRARGGAVVFVGHNPVQMQACCTRGIIIDQGRVLFDGSIVTALDLALNAARKSTAAAPSETPAFASQTGSTATNVSVLAHQVTYRQPVNDAAKGSAVINLTVEVKEAALECRVAAALFVSGSPDAVAVALSDPVTLQPGSQQVTMVMPSLPLLGGDYLVRLALMSEATPYPVWHQGWDNAPVAFQIPGEATLYTNLATWASAKVQLDCQVSVTEVDCVRSSLDSYQEQGA